MIPNVPGDKFVQYNVPYTFLHTKFSSYLLAVGLEVAHVSRYILTITIQTAFFGKNHNVYSLYVHRAKCR